MNIEDRIQSLAVENLSGSSRSESLRDVQAASKPGGENFGNVLTKAVGELDRLQLDADSEVKKVAMGDGNLHEMSIALEKANISMRLALKVKSKVLEAYQSVMRMGG
ncbi:MAG: flagellar hook-basal body complex protein FliE [Deltaproteobacteria bacterium]|nr:flagellar hook-basal body complex protein FliE [Deltaproteobacteria bacterium]